MLNETHTRNIMPGQYVNSSLTKDDPPQTRLENGGTKLPQDVADEFSTESVEDLRQRLNTMKQMMKEKKNNTAVILNGEAPLSGSRQSHSVIDDKFLSFVFMFVLGLIICVSLYAFYNLYTAIIKKFGHVHDEL